MKTLWLLGLLAFAVALVMPARAASSHLSMSSICPFTEQGLAALSLTPEQATAARRIARGVENGLLVQSPVLDKWPELMLGMPDDYGAVPLDQVIVENRARLAELLSRGHSSPNEVRRLARQIAVQELAMEEVVNAGTTALSSILTPVQQAQLPECPRMTGLTR